MTRLCLFVGFPAFSNPQGLSSGVQWLANANANYGMGILDVVNDTQLAWRWFDSTTGEPAAVLTCLPFSLRNR